MWSGFYTTRQPWIIAEHITDWKNKGSAWCNTTLQLLFGKPQNPACLTLYLGAILLFVVCVCVYAYWELLHSLLSSLNFKFVCCTVTSVINSSVFQSTGVLFREMSKNFSFQPETKIQETLVPGCFAEMAIKNSQSVRQSKFVHCSTFKTAATGTLITCLRLLWINCAKHKLTSSLWNNSTIYCKKSTL